jgi:subtilisin family serine protease
MDTVVVLRDPEWASADARDAGGEIGVRGHQPSGGSVPRIEVEHVDARGRAELLLDPEVAAVSPAMPTKLIEPRAAQPRAHESDATWGVVAVKAAESRYSGDGVVTAVLDTGIDRSHPAFRGVTVIERDFSGCGASDTQGHGTHCAGTVLGRSVEGLRIGVAPGVRRMLVGKVLTNDGTGSTEMLFEAMLWAMAEGAHVISISLGVDFPGMVRNLTASGWPVELATSKALEAYGGTLRILDRLMDVSRARRSFGDGAVVVAAAGNESKRNESPDYAIAASLPAAAEGVISVGAVTPDGGRVRIASFSNAFPRVCGPGVAIVSARSGGGLTAMTGTSMACPHVAGVAALWWEAIRDQGLPVSGDVVAAKLLATARANVFTPEAQAADRGVGLITSP